MMKKIQFITFLFLLILTNTNAQKENSNWYFGENAGLNFNTSPTSVLSNGETNYLYNHSAVVSDGNGQLLFYSDGKSVWNKNHLKMTNGNNTLFGGNRTVVISPFPDEINKYYIFTSKSTLINGSYFITKYYYSIVNLTNGDGIVESLNTDLNVLPYTPPGGFTRHKAQRDHMSLTKHSDGESYWLIINPFDYFFALKISSSGLETPIVSQADGGYYQGGYLETISHGSSGMSINSNGTKIAHLNNSNTPGSDSAGVLLYVYNFNNTTGNISLDFYKDLGYDFSNVNLGKGYSVEFSPNNNYLYILGQNEGATLLQLNLQSLNDDPAIISSINFSDSFYEKHTMRLAQDGKIYIPYFENSELAVINNPNSIGNSSNFTDSQVNLSDNQTILLPQLIPFHEPVCQDNLYITLEVNSGQIDNQSAKATMNASNRVNTGATANYDAGITVLLKPGFHAKSGANFRAFIEGCSNNTLYSRNSNTSITYSNETPVIETRKNIQVYPNPTVNSLYVKSKNGIRKWSLSNFYGKLFHSGNGNIQVIQTQNLPKGIYLLKLILNNGDSLTEKIIKE